MEIQVDELKTDTGIDALAGENPIELEGEVRPRVHAIDREGEVARLERTIEGDVSQVQAPSVRFVESAVDG